MARAIFFIALSLLLVLPSAGGAKTVPSELERIKNQIEQERKKLETANKEQNKILSEMELIDKKIGLFSRKTEELKRQQALIQSQIRTLEQEIQKIKARLDAQKETLARRLRARYEMGEVGTLEVLFSSQQISDLVLRDEYLGRVYEMDRQLISEYQQGLIELDQKKTELSEKQVELEANIQAAGWTVDQLSGEKTGKNQILEKVKQEKQSHLSAISELQEAERALEDELKKIEKAEKKKPKTRPNQPEPVNAPPLSKFCMPVTGKIEEKFGPRIDPTFGTQTTHKGVDIDARPGQTVRAIGSGQVAYADWFRGYGNLVIIDHNNGYYSLYAHLDRIDKSAGDEVRKGQALGTVGDTGSLKGPFLYFELRFHTQAVDPENYLETNCVVSAVSQ
jgi:murein hydrolase activator